MNSPDHIEKDALSEGDFGSSSTEIYRSVGDVELKMHVFRSGGDTAAPALCMFSGGGWMQGSPVQFREHAKYLSSRGLTVFLPEYRVSTRHNSRLGDSIDDSRAAFAWIVENAARFGVDPDRIAAGGGSAGGYLAGALSLPSEVDDVTPQSKPDALVMLNPPLDLTGIFAQALRVFASPTGPLRGVKLADYTLRTRVRPGLPPALVMHGAADEVISLESVEAVVKESVAEGNDWRLITYDGQAHGFFNFPAPTADGPIGWQFAAALEQIDRFFVELGWIDGPPTLSVVTSWPS